MGDDGPDGKPRPHQRPAFVLLDLNAHGYALHNLGELAGDDIAGHQSELRPGRFVDPDDTAAEWLGEGVHLQFDRITWCDAAQARLFQISRHIKQIGVVHAQDGDARRGEIA